MANEQTTIAVVNAVAVVLPSVVSLVKALAAKTSPGTPPPTDAEVLAALESTCAKSLAVDEAWLAAHPA